MVRKTAGGLILAALLAGCVPSTEIDQPVLRVVATSPAKDRVVGQTGLVLRTYVLDEAGKEKEVSGAMCQLRSKDIAAQTTSPRLLSVPTYAQGARFPNRGAPAPAVVTCRLNDLKGSVRIEPVPLGSPARRQSTTTVAGGATITTTTRPITRGMAAAYPWSYGGKVSVTLR